MVRCRLCVFLFLSKKTSDRKNGQNALTSNINSKAERQIVHINIFRIIVYLKLVLFSNLIEFYDICSPVSFTHTHVIHIYSVSWLPIRSPLHITRSVDIYIVHLNVFNMLSFHFHFIQSLRCSFEFNTYLQK